MKAANEQNLVNSSKNTALSLLENRNSESLAILSGNSLKDLEEHLQGLLDSVKLERMRKLFVEKAMKSGENAEFLGKAMKVFSESKSNLDSSKLDFASLFPASKPGHSRNNSGTSYPLKLSNSNKYNRSLEKENNLTGERMGRRKSNESSCALENLRKKIIAEEETRKRKDKEHKSHFY